MYLGLLEENQQLRQLLQQVSGFVGKGLGGHSHELGFQNVHDFEEFVDRADRDTLHRIHEGWKTKYSKHHKADSSTPHSSNAHGSHNGLSQSNSKQSEGEAHPVLKLVAPVKGQQNSALDHSPPSPGIAKNSASLFSDSIARKRNRDEEHSSQHNAASLLPGIPAPTASSSGGIFRPSQFPNDSIAHPQPQSNDTLQYNYGSDAAPQASSSASSSFFFDIADPMQSSFTNDFHTEFSQTGFTPINVNDQSTSATWSETLPPISSSVTSRRSSYLSEHTGLPKAPAQPSIDLQDIKPNFSAPGIGMQGRSPPDTFRSGPLLLRAIQIIG